MKNKDIRFDTIVDAAAFVTELSSYDLFLKHQKSQRRSEARCALWAAIREIKRWSYTDIANKFDVDHTVILRGIKRANKEDVKTIKALAIRLDEVKRLHDTERFVENYGKQGKGEVGVHALEQEGSGEVRG